MDRNAKYEARSSDLETKMLNPKLKILNSKQTQMSKTQNSGSEEEKIMGKRSLTKETTDFQKILGSIVEKSK